MNTLIKSLSILLIYLTFTSCAELNPQQARFISDIDFLRDTLPTKHPNLYFFLSEVDFMQQLAEVKERVLAGASDFEVAMQLREVTANLGDPHTNFGFYETIGKQGFFPIEIFWFADGIWITGAAAAYPSVIGKRIVAINDVPIERVLEKIAKVVPANRPHFVHKRMHYFFVYNAILQYYGITKDTTANFTLQGTDGREEKVTMTTVIEEYEVDSMLHLTERPFYWQSVLSEDDTAIFRQQYFPADSILLVQYNSCWGRELEKRFGDAEAAKNMPAFADFKKEIFANLTTYPVKKLLFDLRFNGGGSSPQGTELIKELSELKELNQKGKLFVAISQHTFSSAVINAMNFRQMTNAILVGAPSGGSPNHYGEVRTLVLPATKLEVYHSTDYFKFVEEEMDAVYPDVEIATNYEQIRNGIDPVYEYVRAFRLK
ncbi:MAG: hypothetical protein AAGJ18_09575 [Bacteroidota bacterium]